MDAGAASGDSSIDLMHGSICLGALDLGKRADAQMDGAQGQVARPPEGLAELGRQAPGSAQVWRKTAGSGLAYAT